MKGKKFLSLICACAMIFSFGLTSFAGCGGKENGDAGNTPGDGTDDPGGNNPGGSQGGGTNNDYITVKPPVTYDLSLKQTASQVEIGVEGVQTWVFKKSGENWMFNGIYAVSGKKSERVFIGSSGADGSYFNVTNTELSGSVKGIVKDISVVKNESDEKILKLTGTGFESTLKVASDSQFVERSILIDVAKETAIEAADISFVYKGQEDEYSEYGYILSRKADDTQYSLPYSFPALAGKLTRYSDDKQFTYIDVVDYYKTADCFKTARRSFIADCFQEGILSSDGTLYADRDNAFVERVCVRAGEDDSFYDLIYDARAEYGKLYDLDVATLLTANSNMNVYDWDVAAYGATYDLMDSRGRPLGDEVGTWGPYGYNNGGSESFSAMDILAGMVRYAIATGDEELYEFSMKYLLQMVTPDPKYGKSYVMPLNSEPAYSQYTSDYFFFYSCFGNEYTAIDSYMGADAKNFGSFKYFSRVSKLGELALLTNNAALKEAYLKLMVMVKRLHGENFEQPVEWGLNGKPMLDFDNGGSSGAEAMWANCMYIASRITTVESEKKEYLSYMQKATDLANLQGFERSSALRDAPKPESIGYIVRCNLAIYGMTGEKSYLNYALQAARGIYFYYFLNSHPHTYFQTLGYGYACAFERWEAFMEMVESLELLVPVFAYTDDPLLYELYLTLRESALSALPVNGYPEGVLGGHSDWLDALFVPFEQPTGVLGDNGLDDGGAASYRRWSKEQYGMGQIYTGALMFSALGKPADSSVLVINYTSTWLNCSNRNNAYKLYNYGSSGEKVVMFQNYAPGNYEVTRNGKTFGVYNEVQLGNGIKVPLEKETAVKIEIAPAKDSAQTKTVDTVTALSVTDVRSNAATVTATAEGAAYYRLYVSGGSGFSLYNTTVKVSEDGVFRLGFEDSSRLYLRAVAYDKHGNAFRQSAEYTLQSNDVSVGVLDDLSAAYAGTVEGWTGTSKVYKGKIQLGSDMNDFVSYPTDASKYRTPEGYMAVYKPVYAGEDVDTFTKKFTVNLSEYPLFDFYPFCKNNLSQFSLKAKIGGQTYTLLDKADGFGEPNYRFDLAKISGQTGNQEVEVIMVSEGFNRGFAVTQMRFVKETPHTAAYDLAQLGFTAAGGSTVSNENGMLVVKNGTALEASNTFVLPKFDPSGYTKLEVVFDNLTDSESAGADGVMTVFDNTTQIYSAAIPSPVKNGKAVQFDLSEMSLSADKNYTLKFDFKILGFVPLKTVAVKEIRLSSNKADTGIPGYDAGTGFVPTVKNTKLLSKNYELTNGWEGNYAFPDSETGYISNRNPNANYGSIHKDNILVDLNETPVIRFQVSKVSGVNWTLKCNDGSLPNDLVLIPEGSSTGTFEVNMADAFKRKGVINLRLDFYVINLSGENNVGAFFDGFVFVKGKTLYEGAASGVASETHSSSFTLNTDVTNYLVLDVPEITYGASWLVYLVDSEGNEYELKTLYETVYTKMYTRSKEGVFKYQLTDILPASLQGTDATFTLKVVLSGKETQVVFGSIRLAKNNDTCVMQQVCNIR